MCSSDCIKNNLVRTERLIKKAVNQKRISDMTVAPMEEVSTETSNEEASITEATEKTSAPKSVAAPDETPTETLAETEASP